jgi:putative transposase
MMDECPKRRRSIRLKGYDYSQAGGYFVTICTRNRECLFGEIVDGNIRLNDLGRGVAKCWQWLAEQYPYIQLDEWIVMPNHFHGILLIMNELRGGSRTAPTKQKPLGRLIGAFKTVSTKQINEYRDTPYAPLWQRNYYEHVIRNETDLEEIRAYIENNPAKWLEDENHPANAVGAVREPPLRNHSS